MNERKINLDDDYIKFIRFGQHFIDKNGEGVLAYISNNSFIDGITHRQMRKNLLESFDEIYILDLHGNAKKRETAPDGSKDENVFDIMQGVSINLFVKTGNKPSNVIPAQAGIHVDLDLKKAKMDSRLRGNDEVGSKLLAKVFHHSLYGKREAKYNALNEGSIASLPWQQLEVNAPEYFFVIKNFEESVAYEKNFKVNELFNISNSGIETGNDDDLVKFQKNIDLNTSEYLYKPFDYRFIVFGKNILHRARYDTMKHLAFAKENLGFIFKRGFDEDAPPCFISKNIIDRRAWSRPGMQGAESIAPLYLYPDSNDLLTESTRTPNLNMQIVNAIADGLGLSFTPEKATTPSLRATPSEEGEFKPAEFIPLQNEGVDLRSKDGVVGMARSDGVVAKLNDLPYNPALKERARELRKAGNLSEVLFWNAVKNKQLNGLDFDRQRVIGNYIVDFYCHECALVVEIDGSSHDDKQEYDAERDAYLIGLGLNVLHVQDIEVKKNLAGVLELVELNIATPTMRASPTTPPSAPLHFEGELKSFAPIDLLDYIYAVLHSPTYRETYKEFLKIDFPRVPYPKTAATFWQLVALGSELRQTHLLETPSSSTRMDIGLQSMSINYPIGGNNVVDKLKFEAGRVYINETQYFENVPELAWSFHIGGYQPAQKWLKDRKGRALNHEDIAHYQKVIGALTKTHGLMQAINKI